MSEMPNDKVLATLMETQIALLAEVKALRQELKGRHLVPSTPLILKHQAVEDSAAFIRENFPDIMVFLYRHETIRYAASKISVDGLLVEFGVATGETINQLAKLRPNDRVSGFDSFKGLPEDWSGTGLMAGRFDRKGDIPAVEKNVELIHGWFNESVPAWRSQNPGSIAYCHIDCDLYSSTVDVFKSIEGGFVSGTIIVFDEYFGFPNWRGAEHKAFMEMLERTGKTYRALAVSHQALVVQIL
jgi:hypothetical protein